MDRFVLAAQERTRNRQIHVSSSPAINRCQVSKLTLDMIPDNAPDSRYLGYTGDFLSNLICDTHSVDTTVTNGGKVRSPFLQLVPQILFEVDVRGPTLDKENLDEASAVAQPADESMRFHDLGLSTADYGGSSQPQPQARTSLYVLDFVVFVCKMEPDGKWSRVPCLFVENKRRMEGEIDTDVDNELQAKADHLFTKFPKCSVLDSITLIGEKWIWRHWTGISVAANQVVGLTGEIDGEISNVFVDVGGRFEFHPDFMKNWVRLVQKHGMDYKQDSRLEQ